MPATRTSSPLPTTLADGVAQRWLRAQYHAELSLASVTFNPTARQYMRNSRGFVPDPSSEVFNHSNHSVNKDDDFDDISLPDFMHVQQCVACH